MKDLIVKMLAALPAYAKQLIAFLSAPKTFIAKQKLDSPTVTKKALTFLAISFGVAFIAQLPFLPEAQNKEAMVGFLGITSAFGFVLNVAVLALSWRIVGGKISWRKYVVATSYFCSVSTLLFLGVVLLAQGTLNILDPDLYKQVLAGAALDPDDLSIGAKVYLVILTGGFLAVYVWVLGVWGAYRKLNQLSRLRSGVAFAVFVILSPFVYLVETFMVGAILPQQHVSEPMPAELVGSWETRHETNSDGVLSTEIIEYQFVPEGTYRSNVLKRSANGTCVKTILHGISGRAKLKGSTLILTSKMRNEIIDDGCSGKKSEDPWEKAKRWRSTITRSARTPRVGIYV